jgi:signal transduction histidine kinase/CheY-like chemotaxis protein
VIFMQQLLEEKSFSIKTKRLTWWYIAALSMVALLTLAGQYAVQLALQQLEGDAEVVNIAGRQRMLSQRLPRLVLEMERGTKDKEWKAKVQELEKLTLQWERNQLDLSRGSSNIATNGRNSQAIEKLFQETEPDFLALRDQLLKFLQTSTKSAQPSSSQTEDSLENDTTPQEYDTRVSLDINSRRGMLERSDAFLVGMDKIVSQYAKEAQARVLRLRWTERCLLIATLVVLLFEGFFIFSPAVASLHRTFEALQATTNQLSQAKDHAESANRAKTAFLARLSHELRTPLHAIMGMISELRRGPLRPKQRRRVQLSSQSAQTLHSLVNDLLDVAGIESGAEPAIHVRPVRLARLIHGAVELMKPMATRKGLTMKWSIEPDVPEWISADPDRLRQVVYNLLQNAIRYTDFGGIECSLKKVTTTPSTLSIAVSDSGRGIAAKDKTRILERFERAQNQTTDQAFGRSLGLGLPITVSIVKAMGGELIVNSEEGQGSCFTVQFPFVEIDRGTVAKTKKASHQRHSLGTDWAVVVDDSQTNRILMRSFLRRLGYKTAVASNLADAIQQCQSKFPSVLILDRHLNEEDGLKLVEKLHIAIPNRIPKIYLVTADIYCQLQDLDRSLGIAAVLHKPLNFYELKRVLTTNHRQPELEDDFKSLRLRLKTEMCLLLPSQMKELTYVYRDSNFARLSLLAHRLCGSCGNAGLDLIAGECRKLEASANHADEEACSKSLSKLETIITSTCGQLVATQ